MKSHSFHLKRLFLVLFTVWAAGLSAQNSYGNDLLEAMAERSLLKEEIDHLKEGEYIGDIKYKKQPISVVVKGGEVRHIGYALFALSARSMLPTPILNFIERYALEIVLPMKRVKSIEKQMAEDNIVFEKGSFSTIVSHALDSTVEFSIQLLEERSYTATWSKAGTTLCRVTFPASYDLLYGIEMLETERRVAKQICQHNPPQREDQAIEREQLLSSWQDNYFILPGESYYTDKLNSNRYYERVAGEPERFSPLYNERYALESLANLLTAPDIPNEFVMEIELRKYGGESEQITAPLNQWTSFCIAEGCVPYFGLISYDGRTAVCSVIMRNKTCGYNHIVRIQFPMGQLPERKGKIVARLISYVPTYNIKYLFEELGK